MRMTLTRGPSIWDLNLDPVQELSVREAEIALCWTLWTQPPVPVI